MSQADVARMRAGWAGGHGWEQRNRESKASSGAWKAQSGTKWGLGKTPNWDLQPPSPENLAKLLGLLFNLLQPMENDAQLGCTFPKFSLWKTLTCLQSSRGKNRRAKSKIQSKLEGGGERRVKSPRQKDNG